MFACAYGSRCYTDAVPNFRNSPKMEELQKVRYTIEPIRDKDVKNVIRFLRSFFFRDEPLNDAVELLDATTATCEELESYCVSSIPEGLSIMAVSPAGFLLGVCLNGLLTREGIMHHKNEQDASVEECQNPKFNKILKFLHLVSDKANVFGQFPKVDKIMEIRILSVDAQFRGQGICKALIDRTKEIAVNNNFPLIKVDCSSHYSAMAVARMGFEPIFTFSYEDYVDENGQRVFNTKPPHTCARTYVLRLNN